MKLRNKRTGDIWEFDSGFSMKASRETTEKAGGRGCSLTCYAHSLAELNAEWEDAQPAEPLIKDEKVRKVVRAWAEANDVSRVSCDSCVAHKKYMLRFSATELFNEPIIELYSASEESLWDDEHYTIAELCGEE